MEPWIRYCSEEVAFSSAATSLSPFPFCAFLLPSLCHANYSTPPNSKNRLVSQPFLGGASQHEKKKMKYRNIDGERERGRDPSCKNETCSVARKRRYFVKGEEILEVWPNEGREGNGRMNTNESSDLARQRDKEEGMGNGRTNREERERERERK